MLIAVLSVCHTREPRIYAVQNIEIRVRFTPYDKAMFLVSEAKFHCLEFSGCPPPLPKRLCSREVQPLQRTTDSIDGYVGKREEGNEDREKGEKGMERRAENNPK